jgi:hypothetical protein
MAQPLAHHLDRHPGLQEQRGVRVPKVMKPDSLQSRFAHEPLECVGEELGVDGGAVLVAEDIAVAVDPL